MKFPMEIQQMFDDFARDRQEVQYEQIAKDPKRHKLTTLMQYGKPASYRYIPAGVDGHGNKIWFCWSCWRNAAGYFLHWREVRYKRIRKNGISVKRDIWAARKVRKRARALAERRAERYLEQRKDQ